MEGLAAAVGAVETGIALTDEAGGGAGRGEVAGDDVAPSAPIVPTVRCAIYTRKSSKEAVNVRMPPTNLGR